VDHPGGPAGNLRHAGGVAQQPLLKKYGIFFMHIVSAIELISINSTLIVQLASFLIFLFIINKIMFKPLDRVRGSRNARMEELVAEITTAQQNVERILATLAEEELKAKEEAFQRQHVLEEDARQQVNQIFEAIKSEIEIRKVETDQKVKEQIQEARQHLARESQKLARVIIEKILERKFKTPAKDSRPEEARAIMEKCLGAEN
jgi:F-type H+-transporting ATPase subunit b